MKLVNLPVNVYTKKMPDLNILDFLYDINQTLMEDAQRDNDFELIRFLTGRFKLIDINTDLTKKVIDLA